MIQESKYLGGDMEHTHLVKGLDYALLDKVIEVFGNSFLMFISLTRVIHTSPRTSVCQVTKENLQCRC